MWSSPSLSLFYTEARKDSMEEVGCDIDLEEVLGFGLSRKNRGHMVMVSEVHLKPKERRTAGPGGPGGLELASGQLVPVAVLT